MIIKTTNSPAITGDGIRLGVQAGADIVGDDFDPKTGALFTGLIKTPSNFVFVNRKDNVLLTNLKVEMYYLRQH